MMGVLVLSSYADFGRFSKATSTGREWIGKMFDSPPREIVYTVPQPCAVSVNGTGCVVETTRLPHNNIKTNVSQYWTEVKMKSPSALGQGKTDTTVPTKCEPSSPFVFCGGFPPMRTPAEKAEDVARNGVFKIADVRRADWQTPMTFNQCRYNNCVSVGNQVTPDTDVVHVYGVGLTQAFPRPVRHPNQMWMYSVWESPHHTHADFLGNEGSPWNNVFDITMSYRVDSDVFVPYGFLAFEPTPIEKRPNYYEIAKGKTKSVAWFVSNCRTPSKRHDYVREMRKFIDVDIYGGCGTPCSKQNGKCTDALSTTYKFYLSFENSICTDYISEKLYKIYNAGMHVIPVTRGRSFYGRYFPNNTFIDAANFPNPRALAEHLKRLGSDLDRYAQMLEVKDQYRVFGGLDLMWCNLCEALNTKSMGSSKYNMKRWFGDGHCITPRDLG